MHNTNDYSESDVRWGYQYYLGRAPESHMAIQHHMESGDIRKGFYLSEEAQLRNGRAVQVGEFCCWRDNALRIVVLSSCQAQELARVISLMSEVSVFGCPVIETRDAIKAEHYMRLLEDADYIFCTPLGEHWGAFSYSSLKEKFGQKVFTYNRIFCRFLHPDILYLDARAPQSPVGDYHSHIVLHSFLSGLSEKECSRRFNAANYKELGFLGTGMESLNHLREKDITDVRVVDWFVENIKRKPLLYTINHPTMEFNQYIARTFLELVGIAVQEVTPALIPGMLSGNVIWPVDEDWSAMLGLEYCTPPGFWAEHYMMPLQEFISRSYAIYATANRELLVPDL